MVREILVYPNPILRKKSKDVKLFNEELHNILDDMNDTMIASNGVGLAAVQIGILQNILIINLPVYDENNLEQNGQQLDENLIEAINPIITHKDGQQICQEGCLSVPGIYEDVKRADNIVVEFYNRFGEKQTMKCEGFLAVAWQHEIDHLLGHVFIEKLSYIKRKKFEKEWRKKIKEKQKSS